MPKTTVIIPHRMTEDASRTLLSLQNQTYSDFKTIVVPDQHKGANWARNEGFRQMNEGGSQSEFLLFSDDDIDWKSNALEVLVQTLNRFRLASYAYGRFKVGEKIWGHQMFDPALLRCSNYISTMSLIRTKDFPGFDEKLKGYQDWDLWLTLLAQGKRGAYCNELIFTTEHREGISHSRDTSNLEALRAINDKHHLNLSRFNTGYL